MTEEEQNKNEKKEWGYWSKRKNWGGWRQDKIDSFGWGLAFIWGALVIVAKVTNFSENFAWWDGWAVFFVGAGIITLIEVIIRLLVPKYRSGWTRNLIGAGILFAIGFFLGDWEGLGWIWVIVLAVIGIAILARVFTRRS